MMVSGHDALECVTQLRQTLASDKLPIGSFLGAAPLSYRRAKLAFVHLEPTVGSPRPLLTLDKRDFLPACARRAR